MIEQKLSFTSCVVKYFDFRRFRHPANVPIHSNRLFAQLDESMSMFPTALGYFWLRALHVAMARLEFTRVPRELTAWIYDWTIASSSPSKRERLVGFENFFSDCVTCRCSFEASFISFVTLVLNEWMVLSFNPGNFNFYIRRAAELSFTRS